MSENSGNSRGQQSYNRALEQKRAELDAKERLRQENADNEKKRRKLKAMKERSKQYDKEIEKKKFMVDNEAIES